MFGVSLDELFNRDKTPVPMVVIQCIQAVDIYGLDTEGIYRVAGSQSHVNSLRNVFDNGISTLKVVILTTANHFHSWH